jgi:hypothetical protein
MPRVRSVMWMHPAISLTFNTIYTKLILAFRIKCLYFNKENNTLFPAYFGKSLFRVGLFLCIFLVCTRKGCDVIYDSGFDNKARVLDLIVW